MLQVAHQGADAAAVVIGKVHTCHEQIATLMAHKGIEVLNKGCFSTARVANDSNKLATFNVQIDVLQCSYR